MSSERIIGEICEFKNSFRKPVTASDRKPGPYPYYGAATIQDWVSDYLFEGLHILVGEDGSVQTKDGRPMVQLVEGKFWVNNHAHILQCSDDSDTRYLAYALQQVSITPYVTGAAQPKVNMGNLKRVLVSWPEKKLRTAISAFGKSLDDRITLLHETNTTLEAIAQALFKSWFVDFDPVHAKMQGRTPECMDETTAALFPDSFEESELGAIPKGWKTNAVGDLIIPKRGKSITRSKCIDGNIPVVAGGLEPAYFHNQSNVSGPVVTISASGANAGFVRLYQQDIWASDCSFVSKEQTDSIYFWYMFLKFNQRNIYYMQQGAAQPHIYPSDLMRLSICIPNSNELSKLFHEFTSPLFEKIGLTNVKIETLSNLRDTILPRLISGNLCIEEAVKELA